jgi:GTP-binding protein
MADVGLVGFPSVGKSTLLSVVSKATPKIGAYPFTTITPNLGVVDVGEGRSFVMADLPGLIEGAHQGVGLGHEFLRHVERTRLLLHVIDMAATDGRDPWEDYLQINQELQLYNAQLTARVQLIVANKMDMPNAADQLELFREQLTEYVKKQAAASIARADGTVDRNDAEMQAWDDEEQAVKVPEIFPISTVTHAGVQQLLYRIADLLEDMPPEITLADVPLANERKIYTYNKSPKEREQIAFTIRRENEDFVIESAAVESFLKRVNLTSYDAVMRFARAMRTWGIDDALRSKGAKNGDTIWVGDFSFEFFEGSDYGDYV